MADEWRLILSPDGTVLGALEGAPQSWIGTRLDERDDVPEDLKEACRHALSSPDRTSGSAAVTVALHSMPQAIHLIVVDAIPLRRTPADLRALLRSALDVLQRQAKAFDVTLSVVVDDQVPEVLRLDGDKIAWAITVLVGNALRYVHHGSQIMPGGTIVVRATYNSAGPEIMLEVQDDGAGIPADKLGLLFSVGPDQPRVGLGLSMIREVVAAHAGHIDVHSDTDPFQRGTRIRLTLPV